MSVADDADFESRLRAALADGAAGVQPDPRALARTVRRRRRDRTARAAGLAVALTAVLALSLVAAGPLVVAPDVAFPPAEQPARVAPPPAPADPAPVARPTPPPAAPVEGQALVVVDPSGAVRLLAPGGAPEQPYLPVAELPGPPCASGADPCGKVVTDVAVRPGSTPDDLVYATRQVLPDRCLADIALFDLQVTADGYGGELDVVGTGGCPTAPVWSPDGAHLAWADGAAVTIAPWQGVDTTGVGVPAVEVRDLDVLEDVRLHSWSTTADGPQLLLGAGAVGGERAGALLGVDGDRVEPVPDVQWRRSPDSVVVGSGARDARGVWLRTADADGPWAVTLELHRADREEPDEVTWDGELVDPSDPGGRRVWVQRNGEVVLFGDGVDEAWVVERTDQGWSTPVPLGVPVRSAAILDPGPVPAVPVPRG